MAAEVVIVKTGVANIASVVAAFDKLGAAGVLSDDPDRVYAADKVMLPGVGAFGAGMESLNSRGLSPALRERIAAGRSTICICLGFQLLCRDSEESPGVNGLGVIPESVGRFSDQVRVPHFGWNLVTPDAGCSIVQPGYAYFANSFRVLPADSLSRDGWQIARTGHDGEFVSAVERGAVVACQFHPELSGAWGQGLLSRWLQSNPADQNRS